MKRSFVLVAPLTLALFSPAARAQGTARSMDIDVSIRSAALGTASNALFWGEVNHWANPALLAYVKGIRFEHGHTRLVPGINADISFDSDVMKVGVPGLGVVVSGAPFLNGVKLDYGESEGTDPSGNPTGTFGTYETIESWGFGISPVRALESALGYAGKPIRPSSWIDATFGMNFKDVVMQIAPDSTGYASTSARDWGVHGRITPVNLRAGDAPVPLRIEVAYGYSELSYNDDAIMYFSGSAPSPVSRHERQGVAVRIAIDHPGLQSPAETRWGWFLAGLSPLLSFGTTSDRDDISAGASPGFEVSGYGFELEVANVAAFRTGHYTDRTGGIDDRTWGYAVGIPIGRGAGLRFEESWFPQIPGLPHVDRRGFSAWFDPLAVRR